VRYRMKRAVFCQKILRLRRLKSIGVSNARGTRRAWGKALTAVCSEQITKDEMKKLLAIGVGAIVAGVLGAILLPVHVHVENREDELARQERELVQRIANEKRIDLDSAPSPTP
jgi:hypothetical protein